MKLWRFINKTRGAVSIFLVIILVPMMTVSALFVDASKVELAKAMSESAGNLTLNTALTNYDTKLKELYGLLATAQNTDDLFSKLEDYYRTCITSSGVSDEDAKLYAAQMVESLGMVADSEDTADIMNMEMLNFTVDKYPGANLANATMMKKEIVEFMKYRAPINTGLSFLSSLKSFSTLSKQSELVEKKQDYYEAQQTVMENLQKAWEEIAKYNANSVVTEAKYIEKVKSSMDSYIDKDHYQQYGKRTIMSLYEKEDSIKTNKFHIDVQKEKVKKYDIETKSSTSEQIDEYKIIYNGVTSVSYLNTGYGKPYTYDLGKKKLPSKEQLKTVVEGFKYALDNANNTAAPHYESSDYNIQFMAQKKSEIEPYISREISFFSAYHKLKYVLMWLDGYDKTEVTDADGNIITSDSMKQTKLKIGNKKQTISDWLSELNPDGHYILHMQNLDENSGIYNKVANDAVEEYKSQFQIDDTTDIATAVTKTGEAINAYVSNIEAAISNLTNASNYLETAKNQLNGEVASAKAAWNNVAGDSSIQNTSMAKQNQAEINQLDTYLNETNITNLKKRLDNIKVGLTGVRDEIKKYTFADRFLGEIREYYGDNGIENVARNKWNNLNSLSIKTSEITADATSMSVDACNRGNIDVSWVTRSKHQPNLLLDKDSMYTYLSSHFGETTPQDNSTPSTATKEEKSSDGKDLFKKIKSKSKSEADSQTSGKDSGQAAKKAKGNISEGKNLPSKISPLEGGSETPSGTISTEIDKKEGKDGKEKKGAAGKSASALGGIFGSNFLEAAAKAGEDFRDKFYVSDYILSMFSYDTIENEYKVEHEKDAQAGDILSLTKNDISAEKNYAYGSEVEYVLYGGKNSGNITKAYGTIFAIRFGFNLVYAFATSEIRDSALAVATPISAATLGIIPAPLIQAVIIIGLACCESGIDLKDLSDGNKVPLYKTSETWHCSISGLINTAKELGGEIVKDLGEKAIDAGAEKLNELLDMSDEALSEAIDKGTGEIEKTVTGTYDQLITENANSAIQQLTTLVNTAVENSLVLEQEETYEEKKTQMKGWVKTELKNWGAGFTGTDLASKVKKEAVNVIINNSDSCIDALFDKVEANLRSTDPGAAISATLNGVKTAEGAVDELGGEIMETIESIRSKITNSINQAGSEIKRIKTEMVDEVKEAAKGGAEKLKETLNNQVDGICGTAAGAVSDGDGSTGIASIFSFSYSDYLRLFLLIGLYANEEKILLRTADVIQSNMIHNGEKDFEMQKAATYVKITADIQVNPTLLALPLFADVENNPSAKSNWYTIHYSGIAGY